MINKNTFQNAKWIIGCKIIQSLVQLVVGMLTARYLGPANYGLIDYAASLVAFAIPVMQLGLQSTLVQEYVAFPEKEGEIIGTHLMMNMVAAAACMIGVVSFAAVSNPGERATIIVCALYSTSLFFQAIEMLQYWFQAKLLSKYASIAMLGSYFILSGYKIWLLITGKSVYWFALSHAVEYGVTGCLLLVAYRRLGNQKLCFSHTRAKALFAKSKHYIGAMLMVVVFNRVANVLLKRVYGDLENGYYAAAITCTCITGFVFLAIIDTARPVILESRSKNRELYNKNMAQLYAVITYLSLVQSIGFTVFARIMIWILYGEAYLPAVPVLQILVWNTAFSYMGYVRNIWILGEGKHDTLWKINFGGAVISVVLNYSLVPRWGACGAALASVGTQFFTNVVMGFVLKPIRENNRLMLKGCNPKLLLEMYALIRQK